MILLSHCHQYGDLLICCHFVILIVCIHPVHVNMSVKVVFDAALGALFRRLCSIITIYDDPSLTFFEFL